MTSLPSATTSTPTFLGIPPEVRLRIYHYTFSDAVVNVTERYRRAEEVIDLTTDETITYTVLGESDDDSDHIWQKRSTTPRTELITTYQGRELLFSCAQVYSEARLIYKRDLRYEVGLAVEEPRLIDHALRKAALQKNGFLLAHKCEHQTIRHLITIAPELITIYPQDMDAISSLLSHYDLSKIFDSDYSSDSVIERFHYGPLLDVTRRMMPKSQPRCPLRIIRRTRLLSSERRRMFFSGLYAVFSPSQLTTS